MPTRSRNQNSSLSSGSPINVDEPTIVPKAQDLRQLMQENMVADLAPSGVNSTSVNFELVTINPINLHESTVSFDENALFNSPNLGPMNSTVSNCKVLTMLTLGILLISNQASSLIFNRISPKTRMLTLQAWFVNQYSSVNP